MDAIANAKVYEPWLNKLQLRRELAKLRKEGKVPHPRMVEQGIANGMPCHSDPFSGRQVFLLSEVLRWIEKQHPGLLRRAS